MRKISTILLILAVTQMAGCAFGTRYVDLSYPPQKQVAVSSPETPPTISGPRTQAVFLVVNDTRETRDRIGNIRNTYGMDTASILTESNVEDHRRGVLQEPPDIPYVLDRDFSPQPMRRAGIVAAPNQATIGVGPGNDLAHGGMVWIGRERLLTHRRAAAFTPWFPTNSDKSHKLPGQRCLADTRRARKHPRVRQPLATPRFGKCGSRRRMAD
ncbi:MAG: hypothetical protein ACE1ZV_00840 [Alphaproteobacteria bacterium]